MQQNHIDQHSLLAQRAQAVAEGVERIALRLGASHAIVHVAQELAIEKVMAGESAHRALKAGTEAIA